MGLVRQLSLQASLSCVNRHLRPSPSEDSIRHQEHLGNFKSHHCPIHPSISQYKQNIRNYQLKLALFPCHKYLSRQELFQLASRSDGFQLFHAPARFRPFKASWSERDIVYLDTCDASFVIAFYRIHEVQCDR
jgi:hypothetical protein